MGIEESCTEDEGIVAAAYTAVGIDRDKNNQYAVKWAIETLKKKSPIIILVHVRTQQHQFSIQNTGLTEGCPPTESETRDLFIPYRGLCARNGVETKEVVIQANDVSKALVGYIKKNFVSTIVVGASSQNALTRAFRNSDVPTILGKNAPDFCSVYSISRGKVQILQSATRSLTPKRIMSISQTRSSADTPQTEDLNCQPSWSELSDRVSFDGSSSESMHTTPSYRIPKNLQLCAPFSSTSEFSYSSGLSSIQSNDIYFETLDYSGPSDNSKSSLSLQATQEFEDEMRRLKLEMMQTMDTYNSACREEEATAKKMAIQVDEWKKKEARKIEETNNEVENRKEAVNELAPHADVQYRKFPIQEIEVATDYFSDSLKIGEGGYGPVYKAFLDHTAVAIKVLKPDMSNGQIQFQREVDVLSSMKHPNMVLLLGACPEYGCLVYEYMENGSLEDRLFLMNNTPPIPWRSRFKIAEEIATCLHFLHQTKPKPLVHRDLKPANILLDRNYVSKIGDVGLARLVPLADSVTLSQMTAAVGTFCYIDPEYQQTGILDVTSDIYSFGITLLQIITAMPPIGLTGHVARAIAQGTFLDILDPALADWPVEQTLSFANLALGCCELRRKDRPDLGSVILPELKRLRDFGSK